MNLKYLKITITIIILTLFSCKNNNSNDNDTTNTDIPINIFAAAGTRLATDEICNLFEKINNFKVDRNYASSGTLARQIANGAECDVYISANKQWIDFLTDKKILKKDSISKIAGNALVVIAPLNSKLEAPRFAKNFDIRTAIQDKITIGDPAYVPVGKYAKQVFDNLGWYNILKNKIVMAKDVSAVLHYVELGECDWGIVYYTEALKSQKIKKMTVVPAKLHKPIIFYIADINGHKKNGQLLSKIFLSAKGQNILKKHGFTITGR